MLSTQADSQASLVSVVVSRHVDQCAMRTAIPLHVADGRLALNWVSVVLVVHVRVVQSSLFLVATPRLYRSMTSTSHLNQKFDTARGKEQPEYAPHRDPLNLHVWNAQDGSFQILGKALQLRPA